MMFCQQCGKGLIETDRVCPLCSLPVQQGGAVPPPPPPQQFPSQQPNHMGGAMPPPQPGMPQQFPPPPQPGMPGMPPHPQHGGGMHIPPPQRNGMATGGFVCSLIGLIFFPLEIIGLILSIIGLTRSRRMNGAGRGLAIAGIVLGVIGIIYLIYSISEGELYFFAHQFVDWTSVLH